MARVTNRDCIEKIPNRFELIILASQRARQIVGGAALTVDKDDDKPTVLSLREIAASTITPDQLRESLLHTLRKEQGHFEENEEELESLLANDEIPEAIADLTSEDEEELSAADMIADEIGEERTDEDESSESSIIIGEGE